MNINLTFLSHNPNFTKESLGLSYNNTEIIIFVWRQIPLFDVNSGRHKHGATNVTSGIDKVHNSSEDRTMMII
jgi:hypothetical protein